MFPPPPVFFYARRMKKPKLQKVLGQPSWHLATKNVELFVTRTGGHVGPITFQLGRRKIQPMSVAPWCQEKSAASLIPLLHALRGDFFCLPFGGNAKPWRGEKHPPHGETANGVWDIEALLTDHGTYCLHLSMETNVRPGTVDKLLFLREGHTAVYCRHLLSGFRGPINPGHHAMLRFPDEPGSGIISTSRFVYGQVFPEDFERPEQGGYSILKNGAVFDSLEKVPLRTGGATDLTRYPARRGFEDLVMIVADEQLPFAWTAVAFPGEGYAWFALKNPRVLRNTVFWISNGGRHYPPWSGRHVNVMGLEEVTAYFHYGLCESVQPNPISKRGHPTCVQLEPEQSFEIDYIMAVAPIPSGFKQVAKIEPVKNGVCLVPPRGRPVNVPLALEFLDL